MYLCSNCVEGHKSHAQHVGSIVNHLAMLFSQWQDLINYAFVHIKEPLASNMSKHKDLLLNLKHQSSVTPEIDPFNLPIIFQNLIKRLVLKQN